MAGFGKSIMKPNDHSDMAAVVFTLQTIQMVVVTMEMVVVTPLMCQ